MKDKYDREEQYDSRRRGAGRRALTWLPRKIGLIVALALAIVLASYVTKQNAKIFIEQLQDRGYQDSRIFVNNNITRVVYGHFDNQNDAYNALKDIHKHKDLSEAWVYKIN